MLGRNQGIFGQDFPHRVSKPYRYARKADKIREHYGLSVEFQNLIGMLGR